MNVPVQYDGYFISFLEYLKMEESSDGKNEYWNGSIIAMAGGTPNHNKLSNSVGTAIDAEIDRLGLNCSVFSSDQKIYIEKTNNSFYPDCSVVCGAEELYENSRSVITNPTLIIEVLSETTKSYDLGSKFESYRSLPSFREYVLIWQTVPKIQSWYKEKEDLWRISNVFGLDKEITLFSLGATLELSTVYKRIRNLSDQDDPNSY